jgi:putative oxidoreductase
VSRKSNDITTDIALLIIRLGFSGAMLTHGWPKLQKLINGSILPFSDPLGIGSQASLILAVIGEVVAPLLLIIGLKTRLSAIPAVATMAVALFMVHWDDPFKKQELALLYLLGFLVLLVAGGGKFSLDGLLSKQKSRKR